MDFIGSKNIYYVIKNVLGLMNRPVIEHGNRTAYIFYRMLSQKGSYEKYEMADLTMLATLHDLGAYHTDDVDNMLVFEMKDYMPHSVYGYLFLKHLSPLEDASRILMYHHVDYSQTKNLDFNYKFETDMLSIAEKVDIYRQTLGERFDLDVIEKHAGRKYNPDAVEIFKKANETWKIMENLSNGSYINELDDLTRYLIFTNDEKRRYMELLMYCIGLKSQQKVADSVTTLCICEELADRFYLDESDTERLYYAALIHDIGMLAIPANIIDADRKLTDDEFEKMKTHVDVAEHLLSEVLDEDVVAIACAHHERLDGSGYPKGLKEHQMNISQQILQVADVMTGLISDRPHRPALPKDAVINILHQEVTKRHLSKPVIETLMSKYDDITEKVKMESEHILKTQKKLVAQFEQVKSKFGV